jgi:hypothetical protein
MTRRWKHRPEGSNWGEFGDDDQLGRLNLVTSEKVRQGVAEVTEGRVFCLSLPLDLPGGNYHELNRWPPRLSAMKRQGRHVYNLRPDPAFTDVWCDDRVVLSTQGSTQWDALCHVGSAFDADGDGVAEIVYYNGFRVGSDIPLPAGEDGLVGARALGIETMAVAGVQGRGVLIDLHAAYGAERRIVGYDDLMRLCDRQKVEIATGDMVCLHTGLAHALQALGRNPDRDTLENSHAALDSRDKALLRWIDTSGMAALIADNFAIEAVPARPDAAATCMEPLHELCIFKLGMPLGELWYLTELARWLADHQRTRFLLTAPPLRLPGAVGSPVTPIATV